MFALFAIVFNGCDKEDTLTDNPNNNPNVTKTCLTNGYTYDASGNVVSTKLTLSGNSITETNNDGSTRAIWTLNTQKLCTQIQYTNTSGVTQENFEYNSEGYMTKYSSKQGSTTNTITMTVTDGKIMSAKWNTTGDYTITYYSEDYTSPVFMDILFWNNNFSRASLPYFGKPHKGKIKQVKRNIMNAIDTYDYTYAINSSNYITSIITVANEYGGANSTKTANFTWVCP